MYCQNCGKPLEEGSTICIDCASKETQNPAPAADTIELNSWPSQPPKQAPKAKKSGKKPAGKGKLIALIAAAVVVVGLVALALFNLEAIGNLFNKTFKSPEDYMVYVEEKGKEDLLEGLTGSYGDYLDTLKKDSISSTGDVTLEVGDQLLDLLKPALQQAGLSNLDLGFLKNINMDISSNMTKDKMAAALGLGLGGKKIATVDMILDMAGSKVYLGIPELNKQYLSIPMEGVEDMSAFTEMKDAMVNALPTAAEVEKLADTYYGIILSNVSSVKTSSKEVTAGGVKQNFTRLTCKITEKDLMKIAVKVLEKAQKDNTLKDVLDRFGKFYNSIQEMSWDEYYYGEYEPVDLYAMLVEAAESYIPELEAGMEDASKDNYLVIYTLVDAKGNICGRELDVVSEGESMDLNVSYACTSSGNKLGFVMELSDAAKISGKGTQSGNKKNMTYTLTVEDTKYATLKVTDYVSTDKEFSFNAELIPADELLSGSDEAAIGIMAMAKPSIKVSYSAQGNESASVSVKLLSDGKLLLGVSSSGKTSGNATVNIPSDTVDGNNQQALMNWVSSLDMEALMKNLEAAGISEELLSQLVGSLM